MERVKVVHIITLLELGGAQQNTLFTAEHLDREKYEVALICGAGALLDEEAKKIRDLKIHFVPEMIRAIHPLRDFFCLIRLARILKKENPQIVHTHSSKAGILGRVAARLVGVPIIIHSIHGFGFNPYQKFFVRWLFVWIERWVAKITTCLIAVSQQNILDGRQLKVGKQEQYLLIRSGVDIAKIRETFRGTDPHEIRTALNIPDNAKIVLNISSFKTQKNPIAFIRLARKIVPFVPNVVFLLVGDGELRFEIEQEIKSSGLSERVKLLGWRRDVPKILSATDVFVLTSLWEGLPRAAVEALICSRPVVAFAVDGLKDIVHDGKNGYLINPNSLDEMSEKLILVLRDNELLRRLSDQAGKTIDNTFDILKMVQEQELLYKKLLRNLG